MAQIGEDKNIIQTHKKPPYVTMKSQEVVTFKNVLEKEGKHSFC